LTIRWTLDTCDCIIDLDMPNETFVAWVQVCQLHKDFNGQSLLNEVLAHNRTFDDRSENLTEEQKDQRNSLRTTEKQRIRNMGDPIRS